MEVTVLFFAGLRDAADTRQLTLSLDTPITLRQLADRLERRYEHLSLEGVLCAVNEHYVDPDTMVSAGDTIAFFPPVAGG